MEFKEWVNLERAGKKKIVEAVSKTFLSGLFDCCTPIHGVRTGGKPRPCRKLLEVVGAFGCEQTVPGIGETGPGNPLIRKRSREDNRRRRYC